jgi:hypothetical protein
MYVRQRAQTILFMLYLTYFLCSIRMNFMLSVWLMLCVLCFKLIKVSFFFLHFFVFSTIYVRFVCVGNSASRQGKTVLNFILYVWYFGRGFCTSITTHTSVKIASVISPSAGGKKIEHQRHKSNV